MANLTSISALVIVSASTAAVLYEYLRPRKNPTVPGPKPWPLLGNIPLVYKYYSRDGEHDLSDHLNSTYGPITRLELDGQCILFLSEAKMAHQIFSDSTNFPKTDDTIKLAQGLIKYALFFMPTDDVWKRHRKFLQPGFGPSHLRETVVASNQIMDTLSEIWDKKEGVWQTELYNVASSITIDVIGLVAFSYSYDNVKNHEVPAMQAQMLSYRKALDIVSKRIAMPPFLWDFYGLGIKQGGKETAIVRRVIQETIAAKRAAKSTANGVEQEKLDPKTLGSMTNLDVLDRLLEVEGWTDEEIADEVIALFFAGGETSANAIVFCCKLIDSHPQVRAKLLQELDSVFGSPNQQDITHINFDDVSKKLTYTECIIKESLRLHPVVILTSTRIVTQPEGVQMGQHHIEKGTYLNVDIRGIHRNASYWPEPLEFKPERWENGFVPTPGTYMPFGEGPHKCLGFKMAMLEIKVVLARLWHRYSLSVVKEQEARLVTTITHGYKEGILFNVERRLE
jgi:cytochrome P450